MEKGVLLVLLCLSFLLITTFTATDAAALVEDNLRHRQQQLCPYLRPCLIPNAKPKFGLGSTGAEAAALVEEKQKQQPSLCIYLGPCPTTTVNPDSWLGCLMRPGGCNIFGKEDQTPVKPDLIKQHKIKETKSIVP